MAKFGRHFAGERIIPQTFPRANARQLADTGQGFGPQALAEAGGALTDVASVLFKWNEREGNSQYDTLRGLYASEIGSFERTPFKDTTTLEAGFKKLESDLAKLPSANDLKNKSGLKKYKVFMTLNKEARDKVKAEKSIRMVSRNLQSALFINLSNVAQQPDRDKAIAEINTLVQGGLDDGSIKTATQGLAIRDRFINDWTVADVNRRSQTIIRLDGEVDWTATVDYLNQPKNTEGIDSDILKSMKSNANNQKNLQEGRDKENLEILQEEQLGNIYELIGTNDSEATVAINNSALGEDKKEKLRNLIGKNISVNWPEYDKVAGIIDGVARGTHTKEQANQAINEGVLNRFYDTTAATSLRTKLSANSKDDSPTRTPAHTRGITEIEEIMDATIAWNKVNTKDYGLEEESAALHEKNKLKNDLDAFALEKDRTDEEIEEKTKSLNTPLKDELVENWFSRLFKIENLFPLIGHRARQAKEIPQANTQAEYDALPKGTRYQDANGNIGIKR